VKPNRHFIAKMSVHMVSPKSVVDLQCIFYQDALLFAMPKTNIMSKGTGKSKLTFLGFLLLKYVTLVVLNDRGSKIVHFVYFYTNLVKEYLKRVEPQLLESKRHRYFICISYFDSQKYLLTFSKKKQMNEVNKCEFFSFLLYF